ncbi:unnamed protein product [Rhizophagus irregularis]|nr:unnamed protein product [Rhizophagus irregularis]
MTFWICALVSFEISVALYETNLILSIPTPFFPNNDKCWAEPEIIFSDPLQEELVLVELILSSLDMGEQVSKDTYELLLGIPAPRFWP